MGLHKLSTAKLQKGRRGTKQKSKDTEELLKRFEQLLIRTNQNTLNT
jgi:hypothetical protein